ncbi:MAG: hypothetical protein IT580_23550 [Verrucomicrobiales bacterium]|nr:hypothetical protein [Verrucomicrobiales bacterium]
MQIIISDRCGSSPARVIYGEVFGVQPRLAALGDRVRGKLRAATESARRGSEWTKDETDFLRSCERQEHLLPLVPAGMYARNVEPHHAP